MQKTKKQKQIQIQMGREQKENIGKVSLFKSQSHEERNTSKVKEDDKLLFFPVLPLYTPRTTPEPQLPPPPSPPPPTSALPAW